MNKDEQYSQNRKKVAQLLQEMEKHLKSTLALVEQLLVSIPEEPAIEDENLCESLEAIVAEGEHLLQIVNNIVDVKPYLSHELRTPVNTIIGYPKLSLTLLASDNNPPLKPAELYKYLALVKDSCEHFLKTGDAIIDEDI